MYTRFSSPIKDSWKSFRVSWRCFIDPNGMLSPWGLICKFYVGKSQLSELVKHALLNSTKLLFPKMYFTLFYTRRCLIVCPAHIKTASGFKTSRIIKFISYLLSRIKIIIAMNIFEGTFCIGHRANQHLINLRSLTLTNIVSGNL